MTQTSDLVNAIDSFIVGCKTDGTWDAIKASCIMAGWNNLSGALVPLKGTAPTNFNFVSGDYNRKTGLVGDGSTKQLDTNRAGNADPQNNQHASVFVTAIASGSGSGTTYLGTGGGAVSPGVTHIIPFGNDLYMRSQAAGAQIVGARSTLNFIGLSRNVAASYVARVANTNSTVSQVSETPITSTYFIHALGASYYGDGRLAFYSIGESIDLALLDARVTTLIAAYDAAILDAYYANVSLLLHGNGTNGSTTITDNSPSPKTVTAEGNAQISTAQSKFGGASIAFDGTGDRVSVANNAAFDFGTGDFTVECWVFSVAALNSYDAEYAHIAGKGRGGAGGEYSLGFYQQKINWFANAAATQGTTILTNNTWYHFAASRAGSTLRLFVNGLLESSTTNTLDYTSSVSFNAGDRQAGDPGGQYPLNGYIDDLRITKGVARYTSNFTPPTAQFPDS